jgi:hypothetical protein
MKYCLIFRSKFLFNICFKSTKKTLRNGYFNFSTRWPHIFYMLFEKPYDMLRWFLVKNNRKCFENFISFLVPNFFKLIFLESLAEKMKNGYFDLIQICPRFVHSLLFILLIIIFWMKIRFGRNSSKPSLIKN